MKKVLFATTALVMTAGYAAAEVAVSGDGRMGLRYESDTGYYMDDNANGINDADSSWNVINRIRVKFALSGESDAGLSFGAHLRSDQHANAGDNNSATSGDIWISGAYGKLMIGDIDSAMEKAVGDLPEVGLSGLDYWNEFAYVGSEEVDGDGGVLYEYSINNFNLYASFFDGYYGNTDNDRDTQTWSLGVGYDMGNYTFGLGYTKADYTINPFTIGDDGEFTALIGPLGFDSDSEVWGLSGGMVYGGFTFKAAYMDTDSDDDNLDYSQYGLGAEYDMNNGVALTGFYRKNDFDNIDLDGDAFGIGASYDLGGGATLKGGIVDASIDAGSESFDNTLADFGISFNF